MENQIKINGQTASGESLEWLMRQDLNHLHHFIATQVVAGIIEDSKSYNTAPSAPEAKGIYVLLNFLNILREIKEGRAEETK